jgi:VIT1/CCC1 family predicted Fe2+/Mn2+ transporter
VTLSPGMICLSQRAAGDYCGAGALIVSLFVKLAALGVFEYVNGCFTMKRPLKSAWQTMAVGSLAAGAVFTLAKLLRGRCSSGP